MGGHVHLVVQGAVMVRAMFKGRGSWGMVWEGWGEPPGRIWKTEEGLLGERVRTGSEELVVNGVWS